MVDNGRFKVLGGLSFMNQNKAEGQGQQTASRAMNSNSQQAGSDMPVPLRQKKTYKVKSGNPHDAGAQPAPAAAAEPAQARKPGLSQKMLDMPFMRKQQVKRKREEDGSQAAGSEVGHSVSAHGFWLGPALSSSSSSSCPLRSIAFTSWSVASCLWLGLEPVAVPAVPCSMRRHCVCTYSPVSTQQQDK
jgi:hypothetical protein